MSLGCYVRTLQWGQIVGGMGRWSGKLPQKSAEIIRLVSRMGSYSGSLALDYFSCLILFS